MTWEEVSVGYAVCGVIAYVASVLVIPRFEITSPVQQAFAEVSRRLEEKVWQRHANWIWRFKHSSAKWVAQVLLTLVVVAAWPVAMLWRASTWWSQSKEGERSRRKFQNIATSIGVPFVESVEVTPVEKIYILDKITDAWKIDAPGFLDLVITATDIAIMSKPHDVFFVAEEFLSLQDDELKSYCREHALSEQEEARVIRWTNWAQSAEAKAIEGHFRQLWRERTGASFPSTASYS